MKGRARVLDSTPIYRRRGHPGHRHPAARRHPQAARRPRPGGQPPGRPRCEPPSCETTTTPRRASPPVTGTTTTPEKPWSTPWSATLWPPSVPSTARTLPDGAAGGRRTVGPGGRPRRRRRRRRGLSHRAGRGQGPGDLDRGPRGPPRPQVPQPPLRRLQGPPVDRPGLRAHRRGGRRRRPTRRTVTPPTSCWPRTMTKRTSPRSLGDSAYADGATRETLEEKGFERHGQVPAGAQRHRPVHQGPLRASTLRPRA